MAPIRQAELQHRELHASAHMHHQLACTSASSEQRIFIVRSLLLAMQTSLRRHLHKPLLLLAGCAALR